jgi:F5/8 type C domain
MYWGRSLVSLSVAATLILTWSSLALASQQRLVPIAVTASSTYSTSSVTNAVDGNLDNYWSSSGFPAQWIQLDLGRSVAVAKIRLLTGQSPGGITSHTIAVGQNPSNLRNIAVVNGNTTDNQWLEHSGDGLNGDKLGNVRFIRVTTTQSPSWVGWREIEIYQAAEYLGYFGSDHDGEFLGNPAADTAAAGANLTWIRSPNVATIEDRLAAAQAVGSKAILVLDPQIFIISDSITLLPTATRQSLLDAVAAVAARYPGTVAAVYPYDEPYYNASKKRTSVVTMRSYLTTVAAEIRARFSLIPVGTLLSVDPVEFNLGSSYFSMFDWVGFDCYGPWEACGPESPQKTMRYYIDTLRGKLGSSQRMIAVPWAFRGAGTEVNAITESDLLNNINNWHREVISDGKYVAIAPFLWNSVDLDGTLDGNNATDIGTKDLVWTKERIYQAARSLFHPGDARIFPVAVRASQSYDIRLPFAASDRNDGNYWTAGGYPVQWIEFDLGGSTRVRQISLRTAQSPLGPTAHQIYGASYGASSGGGCPTAQTSYVLIGSVSPAGTTQDNQVLSWTGTADVACIRVVTTQSPSWVGWREISIFRVPQ